MGVNQKKKKLKDKTDKIKKLEGKILNFFFWKKKILEENFGAWRGQAPPLTPM
jgi:hypothetical protein